MKQAKKKQEATDQTNVRFVSIAMVAKVGQSASNSGEKFSGNETSLKVDADGNAYVSGQMLRHAMRITAREINGVSDQRGTYTVGDSQDHASNIADDIGADVFGFMRTKEATEGQAGSAQKRFSVIQCTPFVAEKTNMYRDLLTRFDSRRDMTDHALAKMERNSPSNYFAAAAFDASAIGNIEEFFANKDRGFVSMRTIRCIDQGEQMRRASIILDSLRMIHGFAQQSRVMTTFQPVKVLIAVSPLASCKKAALYWENPSFQKNILSEIEADGASVFIGDDSTNQSVHSAFQEAKKAIVTRGIIDRSVNFDKPMSMQEFDKWRTKNLAEFYRRLNS